MQKFRDSQQLDMMYRLAGADDDDDDEPGRKRSQLGLFHQLESI
jgi:hypothetical protein